MRTPFKSPPGKDLWVFYKIIENDRKVSFFIFPISLMLWVSFSPGLAVLVVIVGFPLFEPPRENGYYISIANPFLSRCFLLVPNLMLSVFFSPGRNRACRHCWISSFLTPSGKRLLYFRCEALFKPMFLIYFPQLNVVGVLFSWP